MSRETSLSKFLSLILRHEPGVVGLTLDHEGWVEVSELLEALAHHGQVLSPVELEVIVNGGEKRRLAFSEDGLRIRALQGHSVPIELGYEPVTPPSRLFHGTVARFLPTIREQGLLKGQRHHVHLSATPELAMVVAKRRGAPIVLEVAAEAMAAVGHVFYCTPNRVWLTEHVPPDYLQLRHEMSAE